MWLSQPEKIHAELKHPLHILHCLTSRKLSTNFDVLLFLLRELLRIVGAISKTTKIAWQPRHARSKETGYPLVSSSSGYLADIYSICFVVLEIRNLLSGSALLYGITGIVADRGSSSATHSGLDLRKAPSACARSISQQILLCRRAQG